MATCVLYVAALGSSPTQRDESVLSAAVSRGAKVMVCLLEGAAVVPEAPEEADQPIGGALAGEGEAEALSGLPETAVPSADRLGESWDTEVFRSAGAGSEMGPGGGRQVPRRSDLLTGAAAPTSAGARGAPFAEPSSRPSGREYEGAKGLWEASLKSAHQRSSTANDGSSIVTVVQPAAATTADEEASVSSTSGAKGPDFVRNWILQQATKRQRTVA